MARIVNISLQTLRGPPRSSEKKEWLKNGGKNIFLILCLSGRKMVVVPRSHSTDASLAFCLWLDVVWFHVICADSRKEKTDKGF